jgi:hypothetical protein
MTSSTARLRQIAHRPMALWNGSTAMPWTSSSEKPSATGAIGPSRPYKKTWTSGSNVTTINVLTRATATWANDPSIPSLGSSNVFASKLGYILIHLSSNPYLVMARADLATVQKLVGHKDIKTTMRYAHLAPDHLKNAVTRPDFGTNLAQVPIEEAKSPQADMT